MARRALLACGLAAAAITGCSSAPAAITPATPQATASASHGPSAAPLSCKQQGDAWKKDHGGLISRFQKTLTPFSSGTVTSAQARALATTAREMADAALPACADPKGYYTQAMAALTTAGEAASGGGALDELGAIAPLENALTALNELQAEMVQTIGSSRL